MTPHDPVRPVHLLLLVAFVLATFMGGCTSKPDPTRLSMLEGDTGARLEWNDLVARTLDADVVVLGEEHDDSTAHAFQLALVADVVALDERERATVCACTAHPHH